MQSAATSAGLLWTTPRRLRSDVAERRRDEPATPSARRHENFLAAYGNKTRPRLAENPNIKAISRLGNAQPASSATKRKTAFVSRGNPSRIKN